MSKIISIATSLPEHKHPQNELYNFADKVHSHDALESRKLRFLYRHSAIENRYSVIPDFNCEASERKFFPPSENLEPFPGIEKRMQLFDEYAPSLAAKAIYSCIENKIKKEAITHLITVSCTGISAPGLDLLVMEEMDLPTGIVRSSVNFMGCYAAIHAMKIADAFCKADINAKVVVVCTELCTLHFQKEKNIDNITSTILFGDGCAAFLMVNDSAEKGLVIDQFFSHVNVKGKKEMAWKISANGFLMTLSGEIPDIIKKDFLQFTTDALAQSDLTKDAIKYWCIHPGGRKILEAISDALQLKENELQFSYDVLRDYGNMSSPTILFVLKKIFDEMAEKRNNEKVFGTAFGPGLTIETFLAHYD